MLSNEKNIKASVNTNVMDHIIAILGNTVHGNISLTFQDGRLVQIERNEKFRPADLTEKMPHNIAAAKVKFDTAALSRRIQEAFAGLEYGQVAIAVKEGKVSQIDRTEKQRLASLIGVYGDGI